MPRAEKITNEVLAERIASMHDDVKDMKTDVRENTKFRHQAKGIIGAISFISAAIGGAVLWVANKIWPN